MPITIGSNIASLGAQRAFANATKEVGTSSERLASGMRINKASDDAAGLAISEQLNSDSKVFTQAIRNVNDGISALTIAEGAISELSDIVIRIRELATQSSNGAISNTQREAIDEEAQALSKEFTRIQQSTEFNDMGLLNGATDDIRIQAGYGTDGSIAAGIGDFLATGTFGNRDTLLTEVGSYGRNNAVTTGDLNGDGVLDLISAGYADGGAYYESFVTIRLGKGNGTFGTASNHQMGTGPTTSTGNAIVTGDLNGDGVLDLISAVTAYDQGMYSEQGFATIMFGNGNGTFEDPTSYKMEGGVGGASSNAITTGDLNGDGVLDLISAGHGNYQSSATIRLGNGDGTFKAATSYVMEGGGSSRTNAVTTGDLNGDGFLDLISAGYGNYQVSETVRLGNGDGTFKAATNYATPGSWGAEAYAMTTGDLNGDGILDLISARHGGSQGSATIRLGNGDGTFKAATSYVMEGGGSSRTNAAATGDLNGDGVLDLISAGYNDNSQGSATIRLGRGNGTFGTATNYMMDTIESYAITLGDLDGDGVLDIVSAGYSGNGSTTIRLGESKSGVNPLLEFSLKTKEDSLQALAPLDNKLESLNQQRGFIGAFQSRLEVSKNVLQVSTENFKAAESRIKDADIAQEAANLTRTQILQQGAAAVLAQANQQPSLALTLLS